MVETGIRFESGTLLRDGTFELDGTIEQRAGGGPKLAQYTGQLYYQTMAQNTRHASRTEEYKLTRTQMEWEFAADGVSRSSVQHATCNMQRATCNMQHATCFSNRDAHLLSAGGATCNMQYATCNMQHATCNMQHAFGLRMVFWWLHREGATSSIQSTSQRSSQSAMIVFGKAGSCSQLPRSRVDGRVNIASF